MVFIRVLGHGLIPRTTYIAPKYEPYGVDFKTLKVILGHGGLVAQIQNPYNTKEFTTVNAQNIKDLYTKYDGIMPGTKNPVTQVKASNPETRNVMVVKDEPKPVQKEEPKEAKEQQKDNKNKFKPVGNPTETK